MTAPPTVIVINEGEPSLDQTTNDELILVDPLCDAPQLQHTVSTHKPLMLTPTCANDVFSQNIEKLTSVRGRIGKRTFRFKYFNDSKLPEWLPEHILHPHLVLDYFVTEDSKRVLKTALLARARALRPAQVDDESNPHSTRSKNPTIVAS